MIERFRSWMFVPGHSAKMVDKSFGLDVDVVMLDLEDGVVPTLRAEARPIVAAALRAQAGRPGPKRYVRINAVPTDDFKKDLAAVIVEGVEGLVVPKVETVAELAELDERLTRLERERGLVEGQIKLAVAIETAKGLLASPALAATSPRVAGLIFGAEDFSRDLGLLTVRSVLSGEFIHARSTIVMAAAAAGVMAVDSVWPEIADLVGLEKDANLGRALGFQGKSLIHPGQLDPINKVFSPTVEEIQFAKSLVTEFEAAFAAGRGSISFVGKLVDRPIYHRALATIRAGERNAAQYGALQDGASL